MGRNQFIQITVLNIVFLTLYFAYSVLTTTNGLELNPQTNEPSNAISNEYFNNKTIRWVIPFKEGGGGDTWARFNAPYFTEHIAGNPVILVTNIPGGGSIKGANYFAENVDADGLMLLGTSGTTQMPYLLDDPRVKYDYNKYKPVMAYPTGGVVYCSPTLGINDGSEIDKILNRPLKYASQGPTSLDSRSSIWI